MDIRIVRDTISLDEVRALAKSSYVVMVKGVADINRGVVALGGEFHMDANNTLIADGSKQKDVWGFNVYQDKPRGEWLEYISLINIRPTQGNLDMEIADPAVREKVRALVDAKIQS